MVSIFDFVVQVPLGNENIKKILLENTLGRAASI